MVKTIANGPGGEWRRTSGVAERRSEAAARTKGANGRSSLTQISGKWIDGRTRLPGRNRYN